MPIGAIVQARTGSSRLPGKVLLPLAGRPMLSWVLERLRRVDGLDAVVVATSTEPEDDAIGAWCAQEDQGCFRGPLEDVAARLLAAGRAHGFDAIVRISGDSPLIDQRIIALGVQRFRESDSDVTSNVHPRRTCPFGESVEVIDLPALERARTLMTEPGDREHVTPALYRHPEEFAIESFDLGEDLSGPSLIVDRPEDAELVEAILERMERPHWEYTVREVLELRTAVLAERDVAGR